MYFLARLLCARLTTGYGCGILPRVRKTLGYPSLNEVKGGIAQPPNRGADNMFDPNRDLTHLTSRSDGVIEYDDLLDEHEAAQQAELAERDAADYRDYVAMRYGVSE